jgi:cysteine synthase A
MTQTTIQVGETPLIEIEGIYAKLECTNPTGSIKDRIAIYILEESERRGLLAPGTPIVEATSGNTGIALAYFGKRRGYHVTLVMPENMTEERKDIIRSLGADLVLVSKEGSFAEAASVRDRLARERGWFNPDQFGNPLNVECHFRTTGEEILRQVAERTEAPIDAFVAGVGTGGTLMGVARKIRTRFPGAYVAAVEPAESPVMSGGAPGAHGIYGIGDGFIPAIASDRDGGLSREIEEVIVVESDDARETARYLSESCGCCVGISSGANFLAAKRLSERFECVVTIFPDGFQKYQSQGLVHCKGTCPFEHRLAI